MSSYVCKKPLAFHGTSYSCGQIIPEGTVLEKRALALIKSGYIAEIDSELADTILPADGLIGMPLNEEDINLTVPIGTENGFQALTARAGEVIEALRIMQLDIKEAEKTIEETVDGGVLILLNACDSRKGIKHAAHRRALQCSDEKEESAGGC